MIQYLHVGGPAGPRRVVDGFNLEVKPGELAHLAGPSGSGKSLLVRMALGSAVPAAGSVLVNGLNPYKVATAARQGLRRVVGAVLDDDPPFDLTAEAAVALAIALAGRPWSAAVPAAREGLERLGLAGLAPARLESLACGERYAVALAAALLRRPHALLVDWRGDDGPSVPGALRDELSAWLAAGGACVMTGEPGRNAAPAGGREVRLAGPLDVPG